MYVYIYVYIYILYIYIYMNKTEWNFFRESVKNLYIYIYPPSMHGGAAN